MEDPRDPSYDFLYFLSKMRLNQTSRIQFLSGSSILK